MHPSKSGSWAWGPVLRRFQTLWSAVFERTARLSLSINLCPVSHLHRAIRPLSADPPSPPSMDTASIAEPSFPSDTDRNGKPCKVCNDFEPEHLSFRGQYSILEQSATAGCRTCHLLADVCNCMRFGLPSGENLDPEIIVIYDDKISMLRVSFEKDDGKIRYDEYDTGIQFYTSEGNFCDLSF
jgi:hypothetical protein